MHSRSVRISSRLPHRIVRAGRLSFLLAGLAVSALAATVTYYGTYKLDGGTAAQTNQTYTASAADTSAVWVTNSGNLTLTNCTISTTGNTSSADNSSFYGLNAGILAESKGYLKMSGGSVTTTGVGANGIFAYGTGTAVISDVNVTCTGQLGHAVMCSGGGNMTVTNLTALTTDTNSGAIATDRGSGTITVTNGTIKTTGKDSPSVYSTGVITVNNATLTATASEAVVIEGLNTTTLNNCTTSGGVATYGGVLVLQSTSGDASVGTATFGANGGSFTATTGPGFFVTNTDAVITLTGVTFSVPSGVLINAAGTSRWGTTGSNGGDVTFTANGETLTGNLTADSLSSINASLKSGTTLTGMTTRVGMTIDSTSTWAVSAASTLTKLTSAGTISLGSLAGNLTVTGNATLGGVLVVNPGSSTPTAGTYTLITAGAIGGTFSTLSFSQTLASNITATLAYTSTAVTLTIAQGATYAPTITTQPLGRTVASGRTASFRVVATAYSGSLGYQWYKDGTAISGETASSLLLPSVGSGSAGSYTVKVTDSSGSVTSAAAALSVVDTSDPGRIINLSILANSGTGDDVLIAGFVLGGGSGGTKQVLLRGMGPSLSSLSVSGYLANPAITLTASGATTAMATNDNWGGDSSISAAASAVGAFSFIGNSSLDAALLSTLSPGGYTMQVSGNASTTGIALAEVYDTTPGSYSSTSPRLINVSARGVVGSSTLTAGFVITGSTSTTVLVRALGPWLTGYGLGGAIANPAITLYHIVSGNSTAMASNDDWGKATPLVAAASAVGASSLASSYEAVLLLTLEPGAYTAIASSGDGTSGRALVEVYEVP